MKTRHTRSRRPAQGFTLVELMVAVAIGMALILAMTLMMARFETGRRSLTSVNDASQGGAYVTYALDRLLRSAGSGYVQGWRGAFGCKLAAARGGAAVLPRASAFPAPFATVPQDVMLAPVVVHAGAGTDGSDVIAVTTGSSGMGESPMPVTANSATATNLRVPATVGVRGNDLVLVYDGGADCMVQQVTSPFTGGATQDLNFSGTYAVASVGAAALANMYTATSVTGNPAWVSMLGNETTNRPSFQLIGVGDNATLVAHDMLRLDGSDTPVAVADGVGDLRVRYGLDTNADNVVDTWADPGVAPWNAATLQSGVAARNALRQIIALRIAVAVRSSQPERTVQSPATLTMFPDLAAALQATRTLSSDEQLLRWRVLDFTVPLRNVLLAPS
jgi:type IV pilus assembly protein PilW